MCLFRYTLLFIIILLVPALLKAEGTKKIKDSSFLIEEAYNQEDGVVQHNQLFQYLKRAKSWMYTFNQEWPIPKQAHQLSYTIPIMHLNGSPSETGLGDISLAYRYQLVMKENIAMSPRFSLVLPTGDHKKSLGAGTVGYQFGLPLSVDLSEQFVAHWNAGFTITPNAKETGGAKANTYNYNAGTSLVWLTAEKFNILTEVAWNSIETVGAGGVKSKQDTIFINPGVRGIINFKNGSSIVPGLSMPIGVGPSSGEYGALVYLSIEHPLF